MVGKIKVVLDARPLSTRISGVGRLIAETIKAFPNKDKYEFYLFSHLPIHEDHKSVLNLKNVHWMSGGGFLKWKGGLFYNLYLPWFLLWNKMDLFWGSQQILPPLLPKYLKVVLTYCDLVLYLYPETMRPLARFQQKLFQRYSVLRADFILSISQQTSDDMCAKFGYPKEKTGVSYPGVNEKKIQTFLKVEPTERVRDLGKGYLLSVSTIEPRKNYPFLLNVYRHYRRMDPHNHMKWVIVGKIGWESPEFIEELKQERSLYKDIYILDSISDSDLQHIYRSAGLFIFASKYEGFGIPMLEALYHNVTCIVSDIPTFHEIGNSGVSYLPYESDEDAKLWAKTISNVLTKPIKQEVSIQNFTWEACAEATEASFQNVLKKKK
ncbi:glycosyltransferase family 1 protein [Leptospira sp. 96542]|nr:glycosyltransferase family 1 protein [Leptospira sp. 96542]